MACQTGFTCNGRLSGEDGLNLITHPKLGKTVTSWVLLFVRNLLINRTQLPNLQMSNQTEKRGGSR